MSETFQEVGQFEGMQALEQGLSAEGYFARRRQASAIHEARVRATAALISDVLSGAEDPIFLKEAFRPRHEAIVEAINQKYPGAINLHETMGATDFSVYTTDVLDRVLYGYYTTATCPVLPLVKQVTLRDLRTVKRFQVNGAVEPFEELKHTATPVAERALTPVAAISYAAKVYAGAMSVNWDALVNSDLGEFNDMAQRMAESWNLTRWKNITSLYVAATGPHTSLYNATFTNLVTPTYSKLSLTNPPLSFQAVAEAYSVLLNMLSPDGQPINFMGQLYLWCTPAYALTAKAIKASVQQQLSIMGGSNNASTGFPEVRLNVGSGVIPDYEIIVDNYIPIVCTQTGIRNTMWGLTYAPQSQARPSIEFGTMRGFETPQLWQKAPNTMRVGGGVDPTMGDFDNMEQRYKCLAIHNGVQVDGRSTVASTGAGS